MLDFQSVTLCQFVELKIVRRHFVDLLRVIQAPDPLSDDIGAMQNQIQES